MQTGKLFVRDRNARAIFCIGFFAAQHPVKDVLPCTENRLIVHRIGDNGSLTVKVAVFHKEILRAAVTFNNVFIDVPEFDRSRRSGQRCFMKAHKFHKLFIREGIGILEKTKLYQGRITVLSDIEKNLVVNVWNLDMNNKGCSASSFTQMTLDELLGNFAKHYTDMEIDRSQTCRDADGTSRDFARAINIYNSLFAKNSDGSTSSFNNALWKQLSISIYSGTKYPEQVLSLALLRSCRLLQQNKKGKENRITASLAGITKAFLIRNYGENMTMGLNSNNTSPAYITGRIFAHMESAQRKIDPNNQTTYAKRFFERVMMNPAKTMPELHKSFLLLKNKAKANGMRGLYNSSDKKIMALIDMLDGNYPDHLSEKQKGEYLVGYYQQRSANIKDAEEKKNRKAAKIETNNTDTATTVATQKEK